MGVPFYGRGPGRGGAYRQLLAQGADPQADVYDSIYYNGIKTMRQKTRLAMERGSGIMIWEISEDTTGTNSLLRAIHEELTSAQ
jgi:GH18 family chitinase